MQKSTDTYNELEPTAPIAKKIHMKKKFGLVNGELRGINVDKLINPPIEVDDWYDWIRDDSRTNHDVIEYIKNENDYTDKIMNPHQELMKTIYNETKSYVCESYDTYAYLLNLNDNWKYFTRFIQGSDYPIHLRKKTLPDGCIIEEELLNVNSLAVGHELCDVSSFEISPTHKYMSYGVNYDGDECYEFVLVNLESRNKISHTIPKLVYCLYLWIDDKTIYYFVGDKSNRIYQMWMYDLSNNVTQLIYEETNPNYNLDGRMSADKNYFILSSGNYDSNYTKYIKIKSNKYKIYDFLPELEKVKYGIEHHKGHWYVHTNKDASNWQILKLNPKLEPLWENLIPFVPPINSVYMSGFCVFESFFILKTKINGNSYINIIDPDRTNIKILTHLKNEQMSWNEYINQDFESIKSENVYNVTYGINSIYTTNKYNIIFTSMTCPTVLYDYDVNTLNCEKVYEQIVPNYSQELYESKRIWVNQHGTKLGVPVSIVYRKDLFKSDGTNPLYLYGYGSYGMSINPHFDDKILPLIDRGYVYAIAHVRGGSFLGYDWYKDGTMSKKINTFRDFIRCAEFFKESGLIDPNKIVIEGRSAGGLLVGASITLRPDLFWTAILGVPFVDVLNTMSDSTIPLTAEEWTQWGNPNEQEWFDIMKEYCPYTNVKSTSYPHMYSTAGLHDPRVPYWEILKLTAKIREFKTDTNTQVVRVETTHGHFGGSSRYKSCEEVAEKYAFILTR